jgi:hypothetical protein
MKYIIFKDKAGNKFPILFPESIPHTLMAQCFTGTIMDTVEVDIKPYSAGKYSVDMSDGFCHGASLGLGLKPTMCDDAVIAIELKKTDLC